MKQLLKAINEVRKATGAVAKNGNNTFHHYKYAMASDVIAACREEMNKQGLIVMPKQYVDPATYKDGAILEATVVYLVAHAESGESMEVQVRAAGEDKGDKKPYKLNTGALKYLLINLFLLPTEDDPENPALEVNKPAGGKKAGTQAANGGGGAKSGGVNGAEKQWLNKGTEAYTKAVECLKKKECTVAQIETKYRLNKEIKAELEAIEKGAQAK